MRGRHGFKRPLANTRSSVQRDIPDRKWKYRKSLSINAAWRREEKPSSSFDEWHCSFLDDGDWKRAAQPCYITSAAWIWTRVLSNIWDLWKYWAVETDCYWPGLAFFIACKLDILLCVICNNWRFEKLENVALAYVHVTSKRKSCGAIDLDCSIFHLHLTWNAL